MHIVSRRTVVLAGTAATLTGMSALARGAVPTSDQELGPFYPVRHLADTDADLTRIRGVNAIARGTPINVIGRVLDMRGNPIPEARIEVWQANSGGRYRHSGDTNEQIPIDPAFQGYAMLRTDRSGNFKFRTVKPGSYPIGGGKQRTPHIHFDVSGRNERLVTQMYFPGEALNATDDVLAHAQSKPSVMSRPIDPLSGDPHALAYAWDIILENG